MEQSNRWYVTVGGVTSTSGQLGSGAPVPLLHQGPSSGAMWDPALPAFAAASRQPIAPDLPGCGMSDPPSPPSIDDDAQAMWETLDAVQLATSPPAAGAPAAGPTEADRVDIVGHHTGAKVGLAMAKARPELVGKLALWGIPQLSDEHATTLANEPAPTYDDDLADIVERWKRRRSLTGPRWTPALGVRATTEILQSGLPTPIRPQRCRPRRQRCRPRRQRGTPRWGARTRSLALVGDRAMLLDETRGATDIAPDCTYQRLGDVGLDVVDETAEAFAAACLTFFDR